MPQTKDAEDAEPTVEHFTRKGGRVCFYDTLEVEAWIDAPESILMEVTP